MADGKLEVRIENLDNVVRALRELPVQARDEARKGFTKISRDLATKIRAEGRRDSRQSALAARTVRALRGLNPGVVAGPHPVLFGSVFGANGRYGWYSADRFRHSLGRQFRPHLRGKSYWFFTTVEREKPELDRQFQEIGDQIIRRWSA